MALIHLWEDISTFKPEILARAPDLKESTVLVEKDGSPVRGLMKIRGVFQRYDCINANGRKYEKSLWERVLRDERVMESINSGSMHGLTEHPEDGKTRLDRGVAIIVTKIWDDGKGNIMGEAVIPGTAAGKDIAAIVEAGGSIGVSSRADGEVEMVSEGYQRVKPETFTLITWDVVSDNSVPGARPTQVREAGASPSPSPSPSPAAAPIAESAAQPRQEPKSNTTMSKIGEMRKIDLAVTQLLKPGFKGLGLNHRSAIYESLLEFKSTVTKLVAEDASVATYGKKVLKMIEDGEEAIEQAPPVPVEGEEISQENFSKILAKVLKDLCPECDDLKVNEQAAALYQKFVEGEPLGITAAVDMLRELADKGGEPGGEPGAGGPPGDAAGAPPPPPPDVQIESALAIIRSLSEGGANAAKLAEAEKALKDAQTKLAEADKTKERLAKNLQLLKESADYIEKADAKQAETDAILEAAIALLKEHKIDDASILLMVEKRKGNIDNLNKGKDGKAAKDAAGDDAKAKEIDGDKKDGDVDEATKAKNAEAEKAKLAEAEKQKAEAAKKQLEETTKKVTEEFAKMNDGKKTVKDIEEAMNAMFKDTDWKKMVNFESVSKEIEAKLTESTKAPEEHDFARQMRRLRGGAFNQLASNSTKK